MKETKLCQQLAKVFVAICEDTDTPVARKALGHFRQKAWADLFQMRVLPVDYEDPLAFATDNNVVEFLRKIDLDVGLGLEEKAKALFLELERQNKTTNDRLSKYLVNGPYEPNDLRIAEFIDDVKEIVASWLGLIPRDLNLRHGPGSTYSDRSPLNTVPDKMSSRPSITQSALCLDPLFRETAWCRELVREYPTLSAFEIVNGNRFTSVAKDALKRRGICIEPSVNVAYQLAIGGEIRKRLAAVGINLDTGQDLHRELALRASQDGRYATIDLSNASDTVSLVLVRLLLPRNWLELLETVRSPATQVDGKWHRLEKFSSMGNGYTFELETLIFAAMAEAVARKEGSCARTGSGIWVYGDDIIVESELSRTLLSCLRYFGFEPNANKTFTTGPFRESCGGDFFSGQPVRAHYVKEEPMAPADWFSLANGLRRLQSGPCGRAGWDRLYKRAWFRALDAIPKDLKRLRGPSSLGDIVIHDDTWSWRYKRVKASTCRVVTGPVMGFGDVVFDLLGKEVTDYNQVEVECLIPMPVHLKWWHWKPGTELASALYGVPSDGPIPRKLGKDVLHGYRKGWVSVMERPVGFLQQG